MLKKVDHTNITKLIDIIIPDSPETFNDIYIVMDHCHTDLRNLIQSNLKLDITQVKHILWNILLGLKHLHDRQVVHRDLKPGNILINKDCSVKICDLG